MSRTAPQSAFDILGVSPSDDFATIRRAWIRLVKDHHPDVVGGDIEALTRKLARFNDAYDSLRWHSPAKVRIRERESDMQTRRGCDRHGTPPRRAEEDHRGTQVDAPAPERDGRAASAPEEVGRRADAPRRAEDVLSRPAPPGEGIWTRLDATEATALYNAIRSICTTNPAPRRLRRTCL